MAQHPVNLLEGFNLDEDKPEEQPVNLLEGFDLGLSSVSANNPDVPGSVQAFPDRPAQPERTLGETLLGVGEAALATATGATGGALGFAAGSIEGAVRNLAGDLTQEEARNLAEERASALTFSPRTEAGQDIVGGIGEALGALPPVGLTGGLSAPRLAATLPTKPKAISSKSINKALTESLPEIKQLRDAANKVFNEIDESGISLRESPQRKLAFELIDKIEEVHGKKAADILTAEIKDSLGVVKVGTIAQPIGAVKSKLDAMVRDIKTPEKEAIRNTVNAEFERFINELNSIDVQGIGSAKVNTKQLKKQIKAANSLDMRATRAELLNNAIEGSSAADVKKSLANILNNKDLSKRFSADELKSMQKVVKGNFAEGLTGFIGKFGIDLSAKQSLASLAGAGLGVVTLGTAGLAIPIVGTAAKQISKGLTTNRAKFINTINRAGTDGERIARAYLSAVPKAKRKSKDLSDLLTDPNIDIKELEFVSNKFVQDSLDIAKGKRAFNVAAGQGAGTALISQSGSLEEESRAGQPVNLLEGFNL